MGKKMRQKRRNIKRGGRIFAQIPKVPVPHAHTKQSRQDTRKKTRLYSRVISSLLKTNQAVVGEQDTGRVMEVVNCARQSAGKGG